MDVPSNRQALKLADIMAMRERSAATLVQRLAEKAVEAEEAQQQGEQQPEPVADADPEPQPLPQAKPMASATKPKRNGCGCQNTPGTLY